MPLFPALWAARRSGVFAASLLLIGACANPALPPAPNSQNVASTANLSASGVVISQVYGGGGNSGATFTHDFVELYNKGSVAVPLAGWSVQYASATGTTWGLTNLSGSIAPGNYYLIQMAQGTGGSTALPTPEAIGTSTMSATNGKVALVTNQTPLTGSCPLGGAVTDFVGFGSAANCSETTATATLSNTTAALRRNGGVTDTDNNNSDFEVLAPNPRNSGSPGGGGGGGGGGFDPNNCAATFTPIFTIQGSGAAAAVTGVVTTQGVVVGDFEGASPTLRGFYLQDATGDGDPATSDGIFVFNGSNNDVALGDVVRVTGTAAEFQGQTQVSSVTTVKVCSSGATITPVDVSLPVASADFMERYEGMLVRFPQTLTVTEHFQLGRFGQVVMSSGGRLAQPTNVVAPGAASNALQAQNDLRRIIVDDALQSQNPDPILFGRGGFPLSAANTLRGGDQATGMIGVLTYTWAGSSASGNAYRLRPIGAMGGGVPTFVAINARSNTPAPVGGTMTVASFNLLNYFNTTAGCTNGVGGAATSCRGADNASEFSRQRAKTIAALTTMNADVVGVMEIENDGYGPTSALADLVDGLNAATAPGTWSYVDVDAATGQVNALGDDAIKVGLLYQPGRVSLTGQTAVLNSVAFVNGGDPAPRNRPALAQAFIRSNGARLVVSVNHLKSKGSACSVPDANDGQGNCNAVRTTAANLLRDWLAADPTDTGEQDALIIGDLNSYAMENPITALTGGGFTNLIATKVGAGAYSYAFDGQWGYLDHALASSTLAPQVTGVTEWHINADEPGVLDYNTEFKSAGQVASLYNADPFRMSDHDPVLIGIALQPPAAKYTFGGFLSPVTNLPGMNLVEAGSNVPLRFSLGGNFGSDIFLPGFPASRPVSCSTGAVLGGFTSTMSPGASKMNYAKGADSYAYNWKTDAAWQGTCRELILRLRDETQQRAVFEFRSTAP